MNRPLLLLNGTSSSGKTSVARALQTLLHEAGETFYLVDGDGLRDMHPERRVSQEVAMPELLLAIPACVATLASFGVNLIVDVDDVFGPGQLKRYVEALSGYPVLYIGVRCSRDELLRRERQRPERKGAALGLARTVYLPEIFDFEADTTDTPPEQCAAQIQAWLAGNPEPVAFRRLAQVDLDDVEQQAAVKWSEMEIVNRTESPLRVEMQTFDSKWHLKRELDAGEGYRQKLSNVHDWVVTDTAGRVLASFVPSGEPQRLEILPESARLSAATAAL